MDTKDMNIKSATDWMNKFIESPSDSGGWKSARYVLFNDIIYSLSGYYHEDAMLHIGGIDDVQIDFGGWLMDEVIRLQEEVDTLKNGVKKCQ